MSDPLTPADDLAARRSAQSLQWTRPENWDGDDWIGPGLPPWGTRPRCPAIRNGHRCKKPAIPGGTVCATHGGAAPQVKRRAKLRVLQLLDPALGQLARILANPDDQRIGLTAIKMVVEMNGMTTRGDVDSTLAKAILMDRHYALQEAARKAQAEMLDGEVIEDADLVAETGVEPYENHGSVATVVSIDGEPADARTQEEIDDDDELLYDPAAAADFAAAERAAFVANAQAELMAPAGEVEDPAGDDDPDPADPGPDDEPIVTFIPAHLAPSATTDTDPSATLS